jgi:hypothetical protein
LEENNRSRRNRDRNIVRTGEQHRSGGNTIGKGEIGNELEEYNKNRGNSIGT